MRKIYQVKTIKTGFLLSIVLAAFIMTNCSKASRNASKDTQQMSRTITPTHTVSFLSSKGDTISTAHVAIANNSMERDTGLMNVTHLPENEGMLFIFQKVQNLSFWMANTPLPLDIIFLDKNKKIIRIHHSAQPYSEKQLNSDGPALYVVEMNGGYCINHDITEGMKVAF